MAQTQNSDTTSLQSVSRDRLATLELFPTNITGCGYIISLQLGEGLIELARIVHKTHCTLVLIGIPDSRERMSAVIRKFGALGIAGLQKFFSARVCSFQRALPGGRPYLIDAVDIEALDIMGLMKSTNGLRGSNLGLVEVACVPWDSLSSPTEALQATAEAMTAIAKRSTELFSGSLSDNWQGVIDGFAKATYSSFNVTILKLKNQLTEEQFLLLVPGPAIDLALPTILGEFTGRLEDLVVLP